MAIVMPKMSFHIWDKPIWSSALGHLTACMLLICFALHIAYIIFITLLFAAMCSLHIFETLDALSPPAPMIWSEIDGCRTSHLDDMLHASTFGCLCLAASISGSIQFQLCLILDLSGFGHFYFEFLSCIQLSFFLFWLSSWLSHFGFRSAFRPSCSSRQPY